MKLVLAAIHIKPSSRAMPLGPAMLAVVLRRAFGEKIRTRIVDLFLDQPAVECADRILASDPDYVGFSMYVWNRGLALEIAALLKQRRPSLVIFAGGYTLYALNARTGTVFWKHDYTGRPQLPPDPNQDGTRIFSSPVVVGHTVMFGVDTDGEKNSQ